MNTHDKLLEEAKKAADKLFADTNVAPETTKESLKDLIEHIEIMLDTLR